MKSKLVIVMIIFSSLMFAQNWTSVKETNINVNGAISVDIFTNGAGNHIIVQESGALKYYKMNVSGTAGSAVTIESSSVVSPSISGDANIIYVVYRKSSEDYTRTKLSTDGGANWSYLGSNPTNSNGSNIESVFSNGKLHITFEVSNVVYYAMYENQSWSSTYTVSTSENGSYPRIAAWYTEENEDKVYFFYQNSASLKKWREYDVREETWSNKYEAFNINYSSVAGLSVDANNIYFISSYLDGQWESRLMFYTKNRSTNNYVSSFDEISNWGKCFNTITADGESHIPVYWYYSMGEESDEPAIYRKKGAAGPSTWDQVYYHPSAQTPTILNVSSSSNDVHVIWKDNLGNNNGQNLRYKYDDQVPLAPQNLAVSVFTVQDAQYPRLSWTLNNAPDVYDNDDGYLIERRISIAGGAWGSWTQIGDTSGIVATYIDYGIGTAGDGFNDAQYRIRAKDVGNYISEYSSSVQIEYGHQGQEKISLRFKPPEYLLEQNFPNPFNPTTKISYQIPLASHVSLKVFDILGNEVATLVNEVKPEGFYEVEFDAENLPDGKAGLPSGVYIYRLQAGKFTSVNKMVLMQ